MSTEYKIEEIKNIADDSGDSLCFKIIIIGDSFVGKSCLASKAVKGNFDSIYTPTVGFEFFIYHVKIDDQIIKLQIWDTCGQEEYRSLINSFYRNSSLAIIVYSVDNEESFNDIEVWLNESRIKGNPDMNFFLVGNKADLEDKRKISKERANDLSKSQNFNLFMETSAKTGVNVKNIFFEAAKVLYEQHLKYKERISRPDSLGRISRISADEENKSNSVGSLEINENDSNINKKRKKRLCCF